MAEQNAKFRAEAQKAFVLPRRLAENEEPSTFRKNGAIAAAMKPLK